MIGHHRDPQEAYPWPKLHLHAKFGGDRSTAATWARAEEIKKKKERKKRQGKKLTMANWVFAQTTHVNAAICGGWSSGGSSKFQVSSKSVERFSSCGGSKIAISYT